MNTDITNEITGQLETLKRQARQAVRYRNLSGEIRKLEAGQLYAQWREASDTAAEVRGEFDEAVQLLGQQTALASQANRTQLAASEKLPALRENEMVRAAVVQRLSVERDNLEAEERRANSRRSELQDRLAQIAKDRQREEEFLSETDAIRTRLDEEQAALQHAESGDAENRAQAAKDMQSAAAKVGEVQTSHDEASRKLSDLAARRASLERNGAQLSARLASLGAELQKVDGELEALGGESGFAARQEELSGTLAGLINRHDEAGRTVEDAEAAVQRLRDEENRARATYDEIRRQSDNLSTEVRTLTKMLNVADGELWPPGQGRPVGQTRRARSDGRAPEGRGAGCPSFGTFSWASKKRYPPAVHGL